MKPLRRHLSYANVVATLALVLAMGGSAIAAKHYLITSTRQISPKVLKQLRGKSGTAGVKGATGPAGATGSGGATGLEGKTGPEGVTGLDAGELATLKAILPHMVFIEAGVGGKPTIRFSAVNVQVVSGNGATSATVNGEGNLVVGYDETEISRPQTGSNNLVVGAEHSFTGFGAILGGFKNTVTGNYSSVLGGESNTASGLLTSIFGGSGLTANKTYEAIP